MHRTAPGRYFFFLLNQQYRIIGNRGDGITYRRHVNKNDRIFYPKRGELKKKKKNLEIINVATETAKDIKQPPENVQKKIPEEKK